MPISITRDGCTFQVDVADARAELVVELHRIRDAVGPRPRLEQLRRVEQPEPVGESRAVRLELQRVVRRQPPHVVEDVEDVGAHFESWTVADPELLHERDVVREAAAAVDVVARPVPSAAGKMPGTPSWVTSY